MFDLSAKGRLIAFEGIDGTGKSTQISMLADRLTELGHEVIVTREPTNGTYGQQIRQLYVDRDSVSREDELALFLADRRQHVGELITPSLAQGKIVLTDRYFLSTAAYQGVAGFDPDLIMKENEKFAPAPDLALIIELPPTEAVRRIKTYRNESLNDFEQEEGLAKVDGIFKSLDRDYIHRINGLNDVQKVHELIMEQVGKIIS